MSEIQSREEAEREVVSVTINAGRRARAAMDAYADDHNRVQLAAEVEGTQLLVQELEDVSRRLFANQIGFRVADSLHRLRDWLRMAETELRTQRSNDSFP